MVAACTSGDIAICRTLILKNSRNGADPRWLVGHLADLAHRYRSLASGYPGQEASPDAAGDGNLRVAWTRFSSFAAGISGQVQWRGRQFQCTSLCGARGRLGAAFRRFVGTGPVWNPDHADRKPRFHRELCAIVGRTTRSARLLSRHVGVHLVVTSQKAVEGETGSSVMPHKVNPSISKTPRNLRRIGVA